ncbi:unnamed protein product [Ceutorhynchus assimilis]|uniref:Uncharacterized protein n=1 Tax=Ceutorhynchus assimilis TaxID=467358 RepID=A0A9N9MTJ5_9CUCU|nr:unnamed protein product [Ceutorhynchus assimilis]
MNKLTFIRIFLAGCIFSVSYSKNISTADLNTDEILLPQEQDLVNNATDQESVLREERAPQGLNEVVGGIGGIINVTSSLANTFNVTRQVFARLRNLTQGICIECRNNNSPSTPPPTDFYYNNNNYYYDYYDYGTSDYSRKKRDVTTQESAGNEILDRQKSNEEGSVEVENFNTENLERLYNALITTYFRVNKVNEATVPETEINEIIDLIETIFIILVDFIEGEEILFSPEGKTYPFHLPEVYDYADYESAETFNKRIDDLELAIPKQIVKRQAATNVDEGLNTNTEKVILVDTFSQMVESLWTFINFFYDIIQNLVRQKRDTTSSLDYLFNFLDSLGIKKRSAELFLSNIDHLSTSNSRKKRFILDLGESYINSAIDFLKKIALDKFEEFLDLVRNYLADANLGNLTGLLKFKRSLPSSGENSRLKRDISDNPSEEEEGTNEFGSSEEEGDTNKFGCYILSTLQELFSSSQIGIQNDFRKILALVGCDGKADAQMKKKRSASSFGALFSEFPRQLSDVAQYIKGTIPGTEGNIRSGLDVVHGFLDTTVADLRKKRDAGDETLQDILPTSEQLDDFFKQLEARIAVNFRAIEATLEQLRTDASLLNIAPVNTNNPPLE